MPVAKTYSPGKTYVPGYGYVDTDASGNPVSGGASSGNPFGNAGASGTGGQDLVYTPTPTGGPRTVNQGAIKDVGGWLGLNSTDEEKNAIARAKDQAAKVDALGATIPGVINASYVDPYKDVQYYSAGTPLDLSGAKADLYDPSTGKPYVAAKTTGRDAEGRSIDYLDTLIAGDGRDAAGDAYYEGKRADAEQAARAQREAGMQNLQERGQANGGAGIMNELYASSDVARNAHNAALGAAAMQQARRDNANTSRANIGANVQGQDQTAANAENNFDQWFSGQMTNYGRDKSNLDQNERVTNFNRTNTTNDANTTLRDRLIVQNKQLPMQGFEMYRNLVGDQGAASGQVSALENKYAANPVAVVGDLVDKGAKVVELANGLPPVGAGTGKKEDDK